ncbi:Basic form of pathogenesis-related protein 1 [Sesamum alatum]|uniref:Basic form of pathogenesis-related protein 1 n=1 Tax=Sesamum alatum TaxID=300844 RepID=A0AAE1Y6I6_9LAMI|nr:Basic form of pathogenesis-related protein 1 [Sesamum alatum]
MDLWVEEKPFYDYLSNSCVGGECGHYTQVMWLNSVRLGCARAQCNDGNQRSKGIKVKHFLRIGLFLAVCFWLIYQAKHSHDKKKEFDENDAKASLHIRSSGGLIKLGRKDVHPRGEETMTKNGQHDEAEEEEETSEEEVDESKHEEEKPEDKKVEEEEEDEIDEHELEKLDIEVDRGEDFVDDEVENETGGKHFDDANDQIEKESSTEDAGRDEHDRSMHEAARDEPYKADDASSAVTHDTHIETAENENERVGKSNETQETKGSNIEETNNGEVRKQLEVEGGEMAKDDNPSNITTSGPKENTLEKSENGSSPNNTLTQVSNDNLDTSNSSTEATTQNPNLSLQNVTESDDKRIVDEGAPTEGSNLQTTAFKEANNSTLDVEKNPSDSNSTSHSESKGAESNSLEFSNPYNNTDSSASIKITRSEASAEAGINTGSETENNEATVAEKSDTSDGTDEVSESAMGENPGEVQTDPIDLSDSSISLEEKDVRTDLDTLPQIQTEGTNNEDVLAE